jgi:A/G-specific adenine glycosylase
LHSGCVALREGRVAELPTPKRAKPLPERSTLVLLARDAGDRVLLQRRPGQGVWASLWSLPEAEDHADARAWFDRHVAGDYASAERSPAVVHGFTHYRLHLQPLRWRNVAARTLVVDNDDVRWVTREQLVSLGIPAPIRKLLQDD